MLTIAEKALTDRGNSTTLTVWWTSCRGVGCVRRGVGGREEEEEEEEEVGEYVGAVCETNHMLAAPGPAPS